MRSRLSIQDKLVIVAGSIGGAIALYGFIWAMALACVAVGHPPEVCGL